MTHKTQQLSSQTPTAKLTDYLRLTRPGQVVSWAQMEGVIGVPPKMYWKGARRALKKEEIFFAIADGVGLRRSAGRMINRAVKVELAATGHKLKELYQNAGYARFVYNWALSQHEANGCPIGGRKGAEARVAAVEAKKRGEKVMFHKPVPMSEVSRRWTEYASSTSDLEWTKERIGSVCRFAIAAVDDAYKHAMRRARSGEKSGWPKYRGRGARRGFSLQDQSFRCTRWAIKIGKLGMVPIRNARGHDQLDVLKGARILRLAVEERAGRWWCSIIYEREDETVPPPGTGKVAGVDLGYSITISDGSDAPPVYDPPKALDQYLLWLQHWSKAMSRRWQKGKKDSEQSTHWRRAKRMVQKLHLRISHIRKDWVEEVSHDLTKRYDVVVAEGFDVRRFVSGEVKHRKGRRTILDIGWGMLRGAIQRKAEHAGKRFEKLEKHALTDQTCSRCGAEDSRQDGWFRCPNESCGHVDLRGRNTADLLYRIGIGDPPNEFGVGDHPRSLSGEDRFNTRGARKAVRRTERRSETEDHGTRTGPPGNGAPSFIPEQNACKKGVSTRQKPRADARHASVRKQKRSGKQAGPSNEIHP